MLNHLNDKGEVKSAVYAGNLVDVIGAEKSRVAGEFGRERSHRVRRKVDSGALVAGRDDIFHQETRPGPIIHDARSRFHVLPKIVDERCAHLIGEEVLRATTFKIP